MGYTQDLLTDVRQQLAPVDEVLKEARTRRDLVRTAALTFPGMQRSFPSGSLAHATANCPIHKRDKGLDADCGAVLSRVTHRDLGPDSISEQGPADIVKDVLDHIRSTVVADYPAATLRSTKRAILIEFNAPLPNGEDPTVDLVTGLERKDKPGLWIPNLEKDRWDPSDPEEHTRLLTDEPKSLRVTRARAIRLAKAANKADAVPKLCSFNIEALAWMFVKPGMGEAEALLAMWSEGTRDLRRRATPDPAGVSAPIKCEDRESAADKFQISADRLSAALAHDHDEYRVHKELSELWPDFVSGLPAQESKARIAAALQDSRHLAISTAGALNSSDLGQTLKRPRSFGQWQER
ncbi:hypothetical protein ACFVWT_18420 [Arthrobacter sp. NPDC058288]|uniref:hypothetical protein n=1 Tax=Arthrobacter sp. NPDC058288 TaxID=3346424 RepID=UPI0036EC0498